MDADLRVADDFCSCVREEVSCAAAPDVPGSGQWQSNGLQRGGVGCLCDGEGRFALLYTIRNLPSINWRKPLRYHHTHIPEVADDDFETVNISGNFRIGALCGPQPHFGRLRHLRLHMEVPALKGRRAGMGGVLQNGAAIVLSAARACAR